MWYNIFESLDSGPCAIFVSFTGYNEVCTCPPLRDKERSKYHVWNLRFHCSLLAACLTECASYPRVCRPCHRNHRCHRRSLRAEPADLGCLCPLGMVRMAQQMSKGVASKCSIPSLRPLLFLRFFHQKIWRPMGAPT